MTNPSMQENLLRVRDRIANACAQSGRDPSEVELLAVSKAHPVERIREAYDAGLRVFGENYAQELADKAEQLADLEGCRWRFIGHLQRNKIKLVERAQASVDGLDSMRLAEALSSRAVMHDREVEVLIQVNIGDEPQKSGCKPDALAPLVDGVRGLPMLSLRGLMAVAPRVDDPEDTRPYFAALRSLAEAHGLETLSMGMTHDLEAAVCEGSTMVRVGTGVFGPRASRRP